MIQQHPNRPIAPSTCTWCAHPLHGKTKYLSQLPYHSICLNSFDQWFRRNAVKLSAGAGDAIAFCPAQNSNGGLS